MGLNVENRVGAKCRGRSVWSQLCRARTFSLLIIHLEKEHRRNEERAGKQEEEQLLNTITHI